MSEDPYDVIKRLTKSLEQQQKDNAALLKKIARQEKQIAARDSTISKLEQQQAALAEHVRTAFATATAYVAAELPKELEPLLAELRRLQDAEWLREIGEVDPKDAN
jgi:predicted nuclease with TOPRIM domain